MRLEVVDSNGLLPLRATERVFTTAHSFRVHLQKELLPHLSQAPRLNPPAGNAAKDLRIQVSGEYRSRHGVFNPISCSNV